jgi:hypothetical protein
VDCYVLGFLHALIERFAKVSAAQTKHEAMYGKFQFRGTKEEFYIAVEWVIE